MEIVAHGLVAAAATVAARRLTRLNPQVLRVVCWSAFPDVLAFGPSFAVSMWLRMTRGDLLEAADGRHLPHVHLGLPLYQIGHSLIALALVFGIVALLTRRVVVELLGWLVHVLIDIPTHSLSYYATRFLWPVADFRVDGIAWWTPWFWVCTYAVITVIYLALWNRGWLSAAPTGPTRATLPDN
jgi:hypothetical protein